MRSGNGKYVALASAALGLAVIVLAAVASWSWIVESWWIHVLVSPEPDKQLQAAQKLGELRSRRAIRLLVKHFDQGSLNVEQLSGLLRQIGSIPAPEEESAAEEWDYLPVIIPCFADHDPEVRRGALKAIRNCPSLPSAIRDCLRIMLRTETLLELRFSAASILSSAEPSRKVVSDAIQEALESGDGDLRGEACRIIDHRVRSFFSFRKALTPLIRIVFQDPDEETRKIARGSLFSIVLDLDGSGVPCPELGAAVPGLIRCLKEQETRDWAIDLLTLIGPDAADATPALAEMLQDDIAGLEPEKIISTLKSIGPGARTAVPALIDLVRQRHPILIYAVLGALGEIGEAPESVPFLIGILKDEGEEMFNRELAAQALARTGRRDNRASAALLGILESDSVSYFKECAALALGMMGSERAVPILREILQAEGSYHGIADAERALGEIGPPAKEAVPQLTRLLDNEIETIRYQAALAGWKITRNAKLYLPILMKTDAEWGREECEALAEIGPDAAEAVPLLDRWKWGTASWAAAKALAKIGMASVPVLVPALKDEFWQLRLRAARILGDIGPDAREAIPALEAVARDEDQDEEVSRAAAEALAKIRR